MNYRFNIGSSNWESIFNVDVVDADGKIVMQVEIDHTTMRGDVAITLSNYDGNLPYVNAHHFYATIAAAIEDQIQREFFGEG